MEPAERVWSYKESPDGRLAAIAARQHGVITRAQALSSGLTGSALGRRLASGKLQAIHPGVYRLAGTRQSWEQMLLAACLWADGVASHRSAAVLWKFEGIRPNVLEVTTTRAIRRPTLAVHRTRLIPRHTTFIGPIPVTTAARTLLDLGAVAPRALVEAALIDALRREVVTGKRLERCLREAGGRGRPGAKVLRSILETLAAQRPESVLELKLLRLLRRGRLPDPEAQYEVRQGERVVARVDFAYPEIGLAIEADGYRYHGGSADWRRDLARRNMLTALGWHVIHVTWADLSENPTDVVARVREALRRLSA